MKLVSFFSGGGFLDLGFMSQGFDLVFSNEIDPDFADMHDSAMLACAPAGSDPMVTFRGSILSAPLVDIAFKTNGDPFGVVGGPPCFPAGTLVLCRDGYKPIEDVRVGDMVLTHKGRWRKVEKTGATENAEVRLLKGMGVRDLITTDDHPFLVRRVKKKWNNQRRSYDRLFSKPEWVKAKELDDTCYVAEVFPKAQKKSGRSIDFWRLVGRYIADGWLRLRKRKNRKEQKIVIVCCGKSECNELEDIIVSAGFNVRRNEQKTVFRYEIIDAGLFDFLREFGTSCYNKTIPGWVFGISTMELSGLLKGYVSGDGNIFTSPGSGRCSVIRMDSVSRRLALSMALIARKVTGTVCSFFSVKREPIKVIQGRVVKQADRFYTVTIPFQNKTAFCDGIYGWKPIKSNTPCGKNKVYNISVEEDHTYMVENVVVHNCPDFSVAGTQAGREGERGQLTGHYVDVICKLKPRFFVMENVPGLCRTGKNREYLEELRLILDKAGYSTYLKVLNAMDFGVPQDRERMFLVGFFGIDTPFEFPVGKWVDAKSKFPWPSTGEFGATPAKPDVPMELCMNDILLGAEAKPNGDEYFKPYSQKFHTVLEGDVSRKSSKRLHRYRYSPTACYGNNEVHLHPWLPRRISVREALRIQGLPDSYVLPKNKPLSAKFKMIGNGVPLGLAKALAESIREFLSGEGFF